VAKIEAPRLLVVGGSGFIGQHVVRHGCELGWDVVSVGLNSTRQNNVMNGEGGRYINLDLRCGGHSEHIKNGRFNYVVNLGGYIDHTLYFNGGRNAIHSHFDTVLNLLESLDRTHLERFVQIGSSDEYGLGPAPQRENQRELPISPYSLGKVAATHFIQMLHRTEALPAVILRLFLVYGPGQDHRRFIPQVILGCMRGEQFPLTIGNQLRDFCFVEDVVRAIFLSLSCDHVNGEVINIGYGKPYRIREVVEQVVSIVGIGQPRFGAIPYREGENMALYPNTTNAYQMLGWRPQVSLNEGLEKTVKWFKQCHV
jgi:UDP-glucose 4-epimerase